MNYFAYDLFGNSCKNAYTIVNGNKVYASTCAASTPTTNPVYHTLTVTADILAIIAGITAVIMIIISGLTMITSRGNTEATKTASSRLIYSVVGLIIIALAWTITSLVVNRLA